MKQEAVELGGAGGEPPRRPFGGSVGYSPSDYTKEIANVRAYFPKKVRREVLKTPQDEMYAAMGVRVLAEMGIKLADYETGLPQDYKLEVLRRSGEFEHVFKENPNFVRYVKKSQQETLFRVMRKSHFDKGYSSLGFDIDKPEDFFNRGVPCLNAKNADLKLHLEQEEARPDLQTIYISSSTDKSGLLDFSFGQCDAYGTNLVFHISQRGLNIVDAERTNDKAGLNALGPALLFEKEMSFVGKIDQRDIIKI